MKYIENGIPEDFAKLCFAGMMVPLCELTDEEYMEVVFGIKGYKGKGKRGGNVGILHTETPHQEIYDKSIEELEFSVRPSNCLKRAGIVTIGQLCKMTEYQVGQLRNMGAKSVIEIKEALAKLDLELKPVEK